MEPGTLELEHWNTVCSSLDVLRPTLGRDAAKHTKLQFCIALFQVHDVAVLTQRVDVDARLVLQINVDEFQQTAMFRIHPDSGGSNNIKN